MTSQIDRPDETPIRNNAVKNIDEAALLALGSQFMQPKIIQLAPDAGIFLNPQSIGLVFDDEELSAIEESIIQALIELSDISRGATFMPFRQYARKPLDLSLTGGNLRVVMPSEVDLNLVDPGMLSAPTTAHNLIENREDWFITPSGLKALEPFLLKNEEQRERPIAALVMEIPGIYTQEQVAALAERVKSCDGEPYNYNLRVRPLDLSTAIQCGLSKIGRSDSRPVFAMITTQKGPNGGSLMVSSSPRERLMITEVEGGDTMEGQARVQQSLTGSAPEPILPVSIIMERAIEAA